jgi:transcriptional/translational regulatory protein YebC/TACO1
VDETVCAEGFGPGGCALLVTACDAGEGLHEAVRDVLRRHGGRAGADNSVAYLFHPYGLLRYATTAALSSRAYEAGAESVRRLDDGDTEVCTDPSELGRIGDLLARRGHVARQVGRAYRARQVIELDAGQAARLDVLLAELRNLQGIAQVYTNAAIPEQFLAPL